MMDHHSIINRQVQALASLNAAIPALFKDAMDREMLTRIAESQLFSPAEDEEIAYWFARFITLRNNLWAIVDTALTNTGGMDRLVQTHDWKYFVLGYSAVCSLIRLDRFLLNRIAIDTIVQRKLNESFPDHRINRKQYSRIYTNLMLPSNAIRIHQAHRILKRRHKVIAGAVAGSSVEPVYRKLPQQERYIDLSKRHYLLAWLRNRRHLLRRRGASARQKSLFAVLEYSGRAVSEISLARPKRVTSQIREQLGQLLQPGDFFITRHQRALTNLFLPGFWPHAALYIGNEADRRIMEISSESRYLKYWTDPNCTLEALKDGVHFRPLEETLNVDAFVVLRPDFMPADISKAVSRVVTHAGKSYNFDFDFFRSDQLVCTEVIYRAFDGIAGKVIPLQERMGRKTLSAEDLLDLALDTGWAEPIAIYGVGASKSDLVTGASVRDILVKSYR